MGLNIVKKLPDTPNEKLPTLVFVHGAWHGAWCWEEHFLPFFSSKGFDCYTFDLPNHGNLKHLSGINNHRIVDYVNLLRALVIKINRPTVLIGHSMGGYIVQQYLQEFKCEAAILLASVPSKPVWRLLFKITRSFPLAMLRAFATLNLAHIVNTPFRAKKLLFSPDLPDKLVKNYTSLMCAESMRVVIYDFLFSSLKSRKDSSFPMLVQCAENDEIVNVSENRETAIFQKAEFHLIKGIAHDVMLESNWLVSATNILEWLTINLSLESEKIANSNRKNNENIQFPNAVPKLIANIEKEVGFDVNKLKPGKN